MARRRSDPNSFIANLEAKKERIKRQIAIGKKELREAARVLHARRARVIGEAMLRLAEHGEIDDKWRRHILADVAAHANEKDQAALHGTPFEIGPEPEPAPQSQQSFGLLHRRVPSADDK
jgi:hypothetical protein